MLLTSALTNWHVRVEQIAGSRSWQALEAAQADQRPVVGDVVGRAPRGLRVRVYGLNALLPFGQLRAVDDDSNPVGAKIADQQDPCGGPTVSGVTKGSPADKAGLRDGDVITKIDSTEIRGYQDLITAIRRDRVGQSISVTYIRAGQTHTTQITLAERPKSSG